MPQPCDSCQSPASMKCSGCSRAWYCNKMCQSANWFFHKFKCDTRHKLTSADYLGLACALSRFPLDKQAQKDFGFQRAFSSPNQQALLCMYQDLIYHRGVPVKTLHRWQTRGVLIGEIKKTYEALPFELRGEHYAWFLENEWVLDGKAAEEWGEAHANENVQTEVRRLGWMYFGGLWSATDIEIRTTVSKWSIPKQDCFYLAGTIFTYELYPGLEDDLSIPFGFCAYNQDVAGDLSGAQLIIMYHKLLDTSSFAEFFAAYETSQLPALFTSKGLGDELHRDHPVVVDILKIAPSPQHSVWFLRQFIFRGVKVDEKNLSFSVPCRRVLVDYGFLNSQTLNDFMDLLRMYEKLFKETTCDPLDLHRAFTAGKLYAYVRKFVKLDEKERYKRLLSPWQPSGRLFVGPIWAKLDMIEGDPEKRIESLTWAPLLRD